MPISFLIASVVGVFAWGIILVIPACGLIPAWRLGPATSNVQERLMAAWVVACVLNLMACVVPFLGYLAVLLSPMVAFGISSCVGGIAGRRAWLFGPLASCWFLLPALVLWTQSANRDLIREHNHLTIEFLLFTMAAGTVGGVMASIVLWWWSDALSNCEDPHSSQDQAGHNSASPR